MIPTYEYEIHLPAHRDPNKKYPTIFTLHGKGSNEQNMHGLAVPLSGDFIIVNIRGDLRLGVGYQYYELKGLGNPIRESFDRAVRQIEAFIQYATEKYPIDVKKRYMLGFSQGAILSMTLALTMGKGLKGIVALNGYVPDFVKTEYLLQRLDKLSVFISHGQFDSVFPMRIGHDNADYFQKLTPHCTFKIYPTDHEVSDNNQGDFVAWLRQDAN
jgi:phospholipase/carboxylesterase